MKTYLYRASNLKSTITFMAFNSYRKSISGACEKPLFLAIYSTLYVGLACTAPPTNTNVQLTFLLTRFYKNSR